MPPSAAESGRRRSSSWSPTDPTASWSPYEGPTRPSRDDDAHQQSALIDQNDYDRRQNMPPTSYDNVPDQSQPQSQRRPSLTANALGPGNVGDAYAFQQAAAMSPTSPVNAAGAHVMLPSYAQAVGNQPPRPAAAPVTSPCKRAKRHSWKPNTRTAQHSHHNRPPEPTRRLPSTPPGTRTKRNSRETHQQTDQHRKHRPSPAQRLPPPLPASGPRSIPGSRIREQLHLHTTTTHPHPIGPMDRLAVHGPAHVRGRTRVQCSRAERPVTTPTGRLRQRRRPMGPPAVPRPVHARGRHRTQPRRCEPRGPRAPCHH